MGLYRGGLHERGSAWRGRLLPHDKIQSTLFVIFEKLGLPFFLILRLLYTLVMYCDVKTWPKHTVGPH